MGFDKFGPLDYFRDVADNLKGNHVITPKVSMVDGIEKRAVQLDEQIKFHLGKLAFPKKVIPKVHLIGLFLEVDSGTCSDLSMSQAIAWVDWMPDDSYVHKKTTDGVYSDSVREERKKINSLMRCCPLLRCRHLTTGHPPVIVRNQLVGGMHISFGSVSDRDIFRVHWTYWFGVVANRWDDESCLRSDGRFNP